MTVSTIINRVTAAGNGSTTAFSFPYYFLADEDLVVILTNTTTKVETLQTITTNYTLTGAGVVAGGTVTMLTPPATGETLTIYRDPTITQPLDLIENGAVPAENLEEAFDRQTMINQRQSEEIARSLILPDGFVDTFSTTLPSDLATADAVLKVNSTGTGFEVAATLDSTIVASAGLGFLAKTTELVTESRTLTATANETSITNPLGTAGNPVFGLADDPILPGNGRLKNPSGTSAQRPVAPENGDQRYNTTLEAFEFYENGQWVPLGAAGGTKSWLTGNTSNFNATVGDWVTFDDGAVATPVDGTGGSPANITIARTTTAGEVLSGTGSLKVTKANTADSQGEGLSVDFTIDYAEQGKMQQLPFLIKSNTGFVNSMFKVFVYDVTNATVLNVQSGDANNGELFATPSTGSYFTGTFIPASDSTSYRLIIMCVTTDTDDFSFMIDEIKPGPISIISSYNVEDMELVDSPESLWSGTLGNGSMVMHKGRDGEHMVVTGVIAWGSTTSHPASAQFITLPNSKTFKDSAGSKNPSAPVGTVGAFDNGTGFKHAYIYQNSSTELAILHDGAGGAWSNTVPMTWANGDALGFEFRVPIEGWTSSDVMSTHRADLRHTIAVMAGGNPASALANEPIIFPTKVFDPHSIYDETTGRATAPRTGRMKVSGTISGDATTKVLGINKNASQVIRGGFTDVNGNGTFIGIIEVAKGDLVDLRCSGAIDAESSSSINFEMLSDEIAFGVKGVRETYTDKAGLATYSITADQYGDLTSRSIPPGTWKATAQAVYRSDGVVTTNLINLGISTTAGNSSSGMTTGDDLMEDSKNQASGFSDSMNVMKEFTITEETTYYLKARATTSITNIQVAYKVIWERLV